MKRTGVAPNERLAWILAGLFLIGFPAWLVVALPPEGMDDPNRLLLYDRPAAMWITQIASILALVAALWARRESRHSDSTQKEKDQVIAGRAAAAASHASLVTLVVSCLTILLIVRRIREQDLIPLDLMVGAVILVGVVWLLVYIAVTLVQYRRSSPRGSPSASP